MATLNKIFQPGNADCVGKRPSVANISGKRRKHWNLLFKHKLHRGTARARNEASAGF